MSNQALPQLEKALRVSAFLLSMVPALYLLNGYYFDRLGVNPFATMMVVSGHATYIFLGITLLITPLRRALRKFFTYFVALKWGKRLSDWNGLIRSRRMFGLFCFFYACIHLWAYLDLELGFDWEEFAYELETRFFLLFGLVAWIILLVLSLTSPKAVQRAMKKWWRRVHRSVYLLPILFAIHHFEGVKDTDLLPWVYVPIFIVLLGFRFIQPIRKAAKGRDTGMEVYRPASSSTNKP